MTDPPLKVRKACLILGLSYGDLNVKKVVDAWKKQLIAVQPDTNVDNVETAVVLNTAKDCVVNWLEQGFVD